LHQGGNLKDAANAYQQILAQQPDHFDALHLSGLVAHQTGQADKAVQLIGRALGVNPTNAQAHYNLATVLRDKGDFEDAVGSFERAISIAPELTKAHNNLGITLQTLGRLGEAEASFQRAVELEPGHAQAHNNLGLILQIQNRLEESVPCFRRALELAPGYAQAHSNLGITLKSMGKLDEAADAYRSAIEIEPNYAEAHNNLGTVLRDQGETGGAIAEYRRAVAIDPTCKKAHSNLLFALTCSPAASGEEILTESRAWDARHAAPLAARAQAHRNDPDPERRLRIGYVSPDFREHSVAYFLEPLLASHNKAAVEVFCYAEVAQPDQRTERFQALADHWRPTVGLSDADLAQLIREDRIDILVDLAGHTNLNRLLAFAEKPAPIQATWLGYPSTTGMAAMDYRITDALADPEGAETQYSEALLRLPDCFLCYNPPADAPEPAPTPAQAKGHITFGSFNYLAKINSQTIDIWAKILQAVPGSRLLIKSKPLADEETCKRYLGLFAGHGIEAGRLDLVSWIPGRSGHLGAYEQVDIALDPFPYNGTTTTCEALWMGIPVIALRGERHAARVGASLLNTLGLGDLVAQSEETYVETAVALAGDMERLAKLRSELRPAMAASPLCDAPGFARNMENAYRHAWKHWCQTSAGDKASAVVRAVENSSHTPTAARLGSYR
jgi:predicted O-linked N-acetylglucosamine transferase (SPINDLY family)